MTLQVFEPSFITFKFSLCLQSSFKPNNIKNYQLIKA